MTGDIDLWTWPTPNGRKVSIMLEECALPYRVHPVNIREGDQLTDTFRALNGNTKIPVIRDPEPPFGGAPVVLSESGAILEYLAERSGLFLPEDPRARWAAKQWLMFQMGGVGPMHGQANHFCAYTAEPHPYSRARYRDEALRLYRVCDRHLLSAEWFAGEEYSIADIAMFPWTQQMDRIDLEIRDFPALSAWAAAMAARPGVHAGMAVLQDRVSPARMTDAERDVLFGAAQHRPPSAK
ncbi:MAG: glutathione binding-like protein [Pseudomonadota bacterium]